MPTNYPGAIDVYTNNPTPSTKQNASGYEHDVLHSNHNDALVAIEEELGTDPKGTHINVKTRLNSIDAEITQAEADITGKAPTVHTHTTEIATAVDDHLGQDGHLSTTDIMQVAQPVAVLSGGTPTATRRTINFLSGTNATVLVQDNAGSDRVDVTVSAATETNAPTARRERVFSFTGNAAALRVSQSVVVYQPETLVAVKIAATAAPTGAPVIIDVLRNGPVAEVSIFTDKPTLGELELTAARAASYSFSPGDTIRVEIDQPGSTLTGENITVTLVFDVSATEYLDHLTNSCQGVSVADETNVTPENSGGSDNSFDAINKNGTGTLVYDNDVARLPAGLSFIHRVNSNNNSDANASWEFPASGEIFGRLYFQIDTAPTAIATLVRTRLNTVRQTVISLNASRQIISSGTDNISYVVSSAVVPLDTWVRLEFRITGGPTGRGQVWYYLDPSSDNPTEILTGTSSTIGTLFNEVQFGRCGTGASSGALTHWQHSVALSTRGKIGRI